MFKIAERLGTGANGRVFKAVHSETGKVYALKLQNRIINSKILELDCLYFCKHHRQGPIQEIMRDKSYGEYAYYVLMDYIPMTLKSILKLYQNHMPEPLMRVYLRDILFALCYLHDLNIVHGDLKSSNVLVSSKGTAMLTDILEPDCIGTPYFMSPEQILMLEVSTKSDIFSFASVAIELLTGTGPLADALPQTAMYHIVEREMLIPKSCPWLEDLLSICYNKDPKERPSAIQLLQHPYFHTLKSKRSMSFSDVPKRITSLADSAIVLDHASNKEIIRLLSKSNKHPFRSTLQKEICQWCFNKSWQRYCRCCNISLCSTCATHVPFGCAMPLVEYLRKGYNGNQYYKYVLKYHREGLRRLSKEEPVAKQGCNLM